MLRHRQLEDADRKIGAIIRERFGDARRLITITADTVSRAEVQDFVVNAAARAPPTTSSSARRRSAQGWTSRSQTMPSL